MKTLKDYLSELPPGKIADTRELEAHLAAAWDFIQGDDGGMKDDKLIGRMEQAVWHHPNLTFIIERHGGTVMGSTRAELQHWNLDVDKATATIEKTRQRQLSPMAARVEIRPIVDEIVELIADGTKDERVTRLDDDQIRIETCKIFSSGSAVKMTLEGRRSRFRKQLAERTRKEGWQCHRGRGFELLVRKPAHELGGAENRTQLLY